MLVILSRKCPVILIFVCTYSHNYNIIGVHTEELHENISIITVTMLLGLERDAAMHAVTTYQSDIQFL